MKGAELQLTRRAPVIAGATLLLSACNRHQSALAPFGADAAAIRGMTLVLVIAAVVVAVIVAAMMRMAVRAPEGQLGHVGGMRLVLWAGGIVPTVVLGALLVYSLPAMVPRPVAPADLRINVTGEQFWWRIAYRPPGAAEIVSANELRLPVGRTVKLLLDGGDLIHSFWVPGLAGKMDMIPGRTNELVVRADRPGRFRGVCTEFCGLSHALMAFDVVAMDAAAFDRWLDAQGRPATPRAGGDAFARHGCGGCHAIRGTEHVGAIGPDLTHFGARHTLAAGTLPMNTATIARFTKHAPSVKPGVRMPAFPAMADADAVAIARYLQALK